MPVEKRGYRAPVKTGGGRVIPGKPQQVRRILRCPECTSWIAELHPFFVRQRKIQDRDSGCECLVDDSRGPSNQQRSRGEQLLKRLVADTNILRDSFARRVSAEHVGRVDGLGGGDRRTAPLKCGIVGGFVIDQYMRVIGRVSMEAACALYDRGADDPSWPFQELA